jgi:hypothetical protein
MPISSNPVACASGIASTRACARRDWTLRSPRAPPERSVALALRARRLVDPQTAATLARALQRVLRDAFAPEPMRARMPTRGDAVRVASGDLEDLAQRLMAPDPPAVRGLAQVNLLVTDGMGPLYSPHGRESLVSAVRRARAALEMI